MKNGVSLALASSPTTPICAAHSCRLNDFEEGLRQAAPVVDATVYRSGWIITDARSFVILQLAQASRVVQIAVAKSPITPTKSVLWIPFGRGPRWEHAQQRPLDFPGLVLR